MKTGTLKGLELYYWVVSADKGMHSNVQALCAASTEDTGIRAYYRLIIKREMIDIAPEEDRYCAALYQFPKEGRWSCHIGRSKDPLTAAMRAFVHGRFGAEVPHPAWISAPGKGSGAAQETNLLPAYR